jgi:hypothetical protein
LLPFGFPLLVKEVSVQVAVMPLLALTLVPTASNTFLAAGSFWEKAIPEKTNRDNRQIYNFFISANNLRGQRYVLAVSKTGGEPFSLKLTGVNC